MAAPKTAQDILVTELKEIHSAERQFSRAVPKLKRKIGSERLTQMLDARRKQGDSVIEELDAIFDAMSVTKSRLKNVAAEGLIDDMDEHMDEIDDERLLDPVLLASVQKLQHYCIASWGTTASLGRLLDQPRVVSLMERLLDEGRRMDEELTTLAEDELNPAMLDKSDVEESEEIADKGKDKPKSKDKAESKDKPQPKAKLNDKPEAKANSKPEAKAKGKPEVKVKSKPEAKVKPEAKMQAKDKSKAKSKK